MATKLFVGGVSPNTTTESLRDFFSEFGPIADAIVMRERGFGFVTFETPEAADAAIAEQPLLIDGQSVDVKHAVGKREKGGGGGGGKGGRQVDSSSEEELPKEVPKAKKAGGEAISNPNHGPARDVAKEGIGELSRKQREEIEKENARRRYEELHKAGKTDEAKADLARLEEVKKRREEAAKKKLDEQAALKAAEDEKTKKGNMTAEMKNALGGEAARLRGERSQANKKKEDDKKTDTRKAGPDLFGVYRSTDDVAPDKPQQGKHVKAEAGTRSGTAAYNTEGDVVEEAPKKKRKASVVAEAAEEEAPKKKKKKAEVEEKEEEDEVPKKKKKSKAAAE